MKKHIGKIIGSAGILLAAFSGPIGKQLTLFFKGKPAVPMFSITGEFDYCRYFILTVVVIGGILTSAGIMIEVISGFRANKKERQIGIGPPLAGRPSHTTECTDHNNGGSAVRGW